MSSGSSYEETIRRYEALHSALAEIRTEFEHGARAFPELYYEGILAPKEPLSQQSWENFIAANESEDDNVWERWEVRSDGNFCFHYYGNGEWFEHFRRLAESGFLILREFEWLLGTPPSMPSGYKLLLPSYDGHAAWTHVVDASAQLSTPHLRSVGRVWNLPDDYDGDSDQLMYETWEEPANGGDRFPKHPFCVALHQNLFRSSAEAIRIWLRPDSVVDIGESYGEEEGLVSLCSPDEFKLWVASYASTADTKEGRCDGLVPHFEPPSPENAARPTYGRLTLGGTEIKVFNQPAPTQAAILTAFEENHWIRRIRAPLHKENQTTTERQRAYHDLRQAVIALNKGTKGCLKFHADRGYVEWQLQRVPGG